MEKEKLDEARKTFGEDKDKFKNYHDELIKRAQDVEDNVKQQVEKKNELLQKIVEIRAKKREVKNEYNKCGDELKVCENLRDFLDELVVAAGKISDQ